jgi:hypothetical protein
VENRLEFLVFLEIMENRLEILNETCKLYLWSCFVTVKYPFSKSILQ